MIYHNFTISIVENPDGRERRGYKYFVSPWGWTTNLYAFKTKRGYMEWLDRCNLKVEHSEDKETDREGTIQIFNALGTIEERIFVDRSEIPKGAVRYKGVVNGSLVDCYSTKTETGSISFQPNPNYEDIYVPMSLEDILAYEKVSG